MEKKSQERERELLISGPNRPVNFSQNATSKRFVVKGELVEVDTLWTEARDRFLEETDSASTRYCYARTLARFFQAVGKSPDEVTPQDVAEFVHTLSPQGDEPAPATVGHRLACLSSFYKFLVRKKVVADNPCDGVKRPKRKEPPPKDMSDDQFKALLRGIPDTPAGRRDRAILSVLALTGLRRAEALRLTVGDVRGSEDRPTVVVTVKGGDSRVVPLTPPGKRAILEALESNGHDFDFLLPEESVWQPTLSVQAFYQNLERYFANAGLSHHGCHTFRHFAAKQWRAANATIEEVSSLLGHKDIAYTAHYLRRREGAENNFYHGTAALLAGHDVESEEGGQS